MAAEPNKPNDDHGLAPALERVIPSTRESVREVELAVLELVRSFRDDEAALFAVRLALEEALTNALRHGNQGDASKSITVRMLVHEDRIAIHIMDEGRGFDPSAVPDPTASENLEIPSGRGLMLMRAYMSDIVYHPPGNHVELVLSRSAE